MAVKNSYNIPVVIEKDKDGFFAFAPTLQGCYTQGDTYEEVFANMEEVVKAHLLDRLSDKEEVVVANHDSVSLTNLRIAV